MGKEYLIGGNASHRLAFSGDAGRACAERGKRSFRMKQYLIFFLFFLFFAKLTAQDISIEFSIEWKDKLDFQFKEFKNGNIHPAYLNITYRNVSDKPLYCLKITEGEAGLPEILWFYDAIAYPAPRFLLNVNDDFFKRRYFVGFKSNPWYWMGLTWDIRNDTTDIEYKIIKETRERPVYDIVTEGGPTGVIGGDTAILNDWLTENLYGIYHYIQDHYYPKIQKKIGKDGKEQTYHYSSDITEDSIMNNSIDKFVFLKSGETCVDKYNLIGFQITGGTFTFQLDDTKSLDYVEVCKTEHTVNHYLIKQLPKKVGEYELFSGEFFTNQIRVQFPGIKLNE
jgi:hypothetical protein